MNLTWLDLTVIAVPFAIILAIALSMRRYLRSVADYLAASRCAGRYLICSALGETGSSVMGMIVALEVFSRTGFSLNFWNSFPGLIFFFFSMLGLVLYRFRQTRSLTFHQFFEVRYSKGVRVFASFLNVFSGIFNFGIQPAVGARFFVYFCGLPDHMGILGLSVPTFVPLMLILMVISLSLALSGGQISVMVTDAVEGLISSFLYLVIAFFIVATVSVSQMREALLSGTAGKSFVDPFDIGGQKDFNGWYILLVMLMQVYYYRGTAWSQGFAAAAKSAHEARMAHILSNWRSYTYTAMVALVSIGAFTLLHHPDFAVQQAAVERGLSHIDSPQLQTQMRMPMAMGVLLKSGVKGAFCAVALFGLLASQGVMLHNYGSTIMQDVILPLRKRPFTPQEHVRWLQSSAIAVAAFACLFSILYKPVDYLIMITTLIGAIYLGGIGAVVWGGLYWKKGTWQGAWAALGVGSGLAIVFNLLQQLWPRITPALAKMPCPGGLAEYLTSHAEHFPLNGVQMAMTVAGIAATAYVVVSLLTCRRPFNMDAMLHRGAYRLDEGSDARPEQRRSWVARVMQVDAQFTRTDRLIVYGTLTWTLLWQGVAAIVLIRSLFKRFPSAWWFEYAMVTNVWITLGLGCIVVVWFAIGLTRDARDLFRTLRSAAPNDADDGTVSRTPDDTDQKSEAKATVSCE